MSHVDHELAGAGSEPAARVRRSTLAVVATLAVAATADLATTGLGLALGLVESNPFGAAALATPAPGLALVLAKAAAIVVATLPLLGSGFRSLRAAGPLAVAVVWTTASVANLFAIVGAL
uniref:hypothetical protein n=1 Tax=Halorubrum sp. T3 TaxID=1194088 RepID=UPI00042E9479|nr:hypothetical protein [Halorubrum sp. T3]AGI12344.1 hypothetical protein [Halorubrum sp. T3]